MLTIKRILILLTTSNPVRCFQIECQLMLNFHNKSRFLRKFFEKRIYYKYHCEIGHTAIIDKSVQFVHPIAVIIGSNVEIEENCIIYQCVTIGSDFNSDNCMPKIKSGTTIGTGAKLIGDITIGKNCTIGANAVVTKSVPDNSIVIGANIIKIR